MVAFDDRLQARQVMTLGIDQPVAVAFPCNRHLIVSDYTGAAVDFDSGQFGAWPSHFPASVFVSAGCWSAEVRSPYLIERSVPDTVPGLVIVTNLRMPSSIQIGEAQRGADNAGALALDSLGGVYFASATRDEITRYTPGGLTRWTTRRGLSPPVARTGIALTLGPDGRLYALGGDRGTGLRVDVLDTATGAIVFTKHLEASATAIALNGRDSLRTFDADSLIAASAATAAGSRPPFVPPFSLPSLRGDTVRLSQYLGKVTLVNFWASWCGPCREEFPHMAGLYARFPRKDFGIAAISDDIDPARMRAFVAAYHPPFPILVGGGRMKAMYRYRGLPYSVLLDRRGRIVRRIFGFGGAQEFRELGAAIAKEIAAP